MKEGIVKKSLTFSLSFRLQIRLNLDSNRKQNVCDYYTPSTSFINVKLFIVIRKQTGAFMRICLRTHLPLRLCLMHYIQLWMLLAKWQRIWFIAEYELTKMPVCICMHFTFCIHVYIYSIYILYTVVHICMCDVHTARFTQTPYCHFVWTIRYLTHSHSHRRRFGTNEVFVARSLFHTLSLFLFPSLSPATIAIVEKFCVEFTN